MNDNIYYKSIKDKYKSYFKHNLDSTNPITKEKMINSKLAYLTYIELRDLDNIPSECFKNCINLSKIIIPKSLTKLGNNCFENCVNLRNIELPNNLIEIGNECFKNCINLSKIIIPKNLTKLGDNCFENCNKLNISLFISLIYNNTTSNAFDNIDSNNITIYENDKTEIEIYKLYYNNFKLFRYLIKYFKSKKYKIDEIFEEIDKIFDKQNNSVKLCNTILKYITNCKINKITIPKNYKNSIIDFSEYEGIEEIIFEEYNNKNKSSIFDIRLPKTIKYINFNHNNIFIRINNEKINKNIQYLNNENTIINIPYANNNEEINELYDNIIDKINITLQKFPKCSLNIPYYHIKSVNDIYYNKCKDLIENENEINKYIKNLSIKDIIEEDKTFLSLMNCQNKINEITDIKNYENIFNKLFYYGFTLYNMHNCYIQNLFSLCCFLIKNAKRFDLKFNENSKYDFINTCSDININDFLFKFIEFHLKYIHLKYKYIPNEEHDFYTCKVKNDITGKTEKISVYCLVANYEGINITYQIFKEIIIDIFDTIKNKIIFDNEKDNYFLFNSKDKVILSIFKHCENRDTYNDEHDAYSCYIPSLNDLNDIRLYVFDDLITNIHGFYHYTKLLSLNEKYDNNYILSSK